ncbi:MAG: AAC(3) family N-acetyltransferase [Xanthobacteraceae bacterium]|nr:AAC(3) family N-acetyltransferase [Xanthobacteraceae bacterium]
MLDRLQRAFAELTAGSGPVVVHGGIWTFAHALRLPAREIPARLLDAMLEAIGPSRTLVMPSYTFGFIGSRVFDVENMPGETGALGEALRKRDGASRTLRAIYSHVMIGPDAEKFGEAPPKDAWGAGSDGEKFLELDAIYVTLGLPWHETCSLFHVPELTAQVPYRYFKRFRGKAVLTGGGERPIEETMFVRSLDVPADTDFAPATERFEKLAGLRRSEAPFPMQALPARTIVNISGEMIRNDPFVFVRNRDAVKAWIERGKREEIARLSPEEDAGLN